ncbi:MAG TPA: hypothetical protein VFV83_06140 [Chthoniobacteraceae bacterium]|nr:hypothetical protein [Chthoniobacteraceae bacterium]
MSLNRRRHANAVPIASIATWILVAAYFGTTGVYYVYCKNRLHQSGALIKKLEREREEARTHNEALRSRIALLSSRQELQRLYTAGAIKLIPIPPDRILHLGENDPPPTDDAVRAVANERSRK